VVYRVFIRKQLDDSIGCRNKICSDKGICFKPSIIVGSGVTYLRVLAPKGRGMAHFLKSTVIASAYLIAIIFRVVINVEGI
jgi:hypothetical protein